MATLAAASYFRLDGRKREEMFVALLGLLRDLDPLFGPLDVRLGEEEPRGPSVQLEQAKAMAAFKAGYLSSSPRMTCDFSARGTRGVPGTDVVSGTIWLEDPTDEEANELLATLESWGIRLGLVNAFAGDEQEIRRRLFLTLQAGTSTVESFVGRNFRQYVPGLFSWNLWNTSWLDGLGVTLSGVPAPWERRRHAEYAVVRCRVPWREWPDHADLADEWAQRTSGVFSMSTVRAQVPEPPSEMSAVRFIRRWK